MVHLFGQSISVPGGYATLQLDGPGKVACHPLKEAYQGSVLFGEGGITCEIHSELEAALKAWE